MVPRAPRFPTMARHFITVHVCCTPRASCGLSPAICRVYRSRSAGRCPNLFFNQLPRPVPIGGIRQGSGVPQSCRYSVFPPLFDEPQDRTPIPSIPKRLVSSRLTAPSYTLTLLSFKPQPSFSSRAQGVDEPLLPIVFFSGSSGRGFFIRHSFNPLLDLLMLVATSPFNKLLRTQASRVSPWNIFRLM